MRPVGEATIDTRPGREALAATRALLDPFLRDAVDTLPAAIRPIAEYHLGWRDEAGRVVAADPRQAIHAALTVSAAEAVGGGAGAAVAAAAAIELVHNFSLLHDDIIEDDYSRRHPPSAWQPCAVGSPLLIGNALLILAYSVLAESGNEAAHAGGGMLNAAVIDVIDGQAQDLSFECRNDVSLAEAMDMAQRKTGALMGCACALGGLFGGGNRVQVEHLRSFGRHLGLALQLADDLRGIWGDRATTGKPVWSSLRSRKKSLPVAAALVSGTPAGSELASIFSSADPLSDAEVARAAICIDRAGARLWCEAQVEVFVSRALNDLELAEPGSRAAEQLRSLARLIGRPDR